MTDPARARREAARTHPRHQSVAQASDDIGSALIGLQREHGLTDAEMLLAVFAWERWKVDAMLRAERHPEDPDKPADQE